MKRFIEDFKVTNDTKRNVIKGTIKQIKRINELRHIASNYIKEQTGENDVLSFVDFDLLLGKIAMYNVNYGILYQFTIKKGEITNVVIDSPWKIFKRKGEK